MPISDGMGLVFAVTSYDGMVFISPTSCREMVPDPEFFAQCIRDSFQELLAIADQKTKKRRKKVVGRGKVAARKKAA
jgi:diacylglycerol O-acyltransferase / wax synthase